MIDARAGRPAPQCLLDPRDRVLVALDERLDTAVEQVLHPPRRPFARGRIVHEPAEAYALNTSANHKPPRHSHVFLRPFLGYAEVGLLHSSRSQDV